MSASPPEADTPPPAPRGAALALSLLLGAIGLLVLVVGVTGPVATYYPDRIKTPTEGAAVSRLPYGLAVRASAASLNRNNPLYVSCFALPGLGPTLLGAVVALAVLLLLGQGRAVAGLAAGLLTYSVAHALAVANDLSELNALLRAARISESDVLEVAWLTWSAQFAGALLFALAGLVSPRGVHSPPAPG